MTKNLSNLYLINGRLLSTANCSSCESLIFLSPNAINQSTVDFSVRLYEFIKPNQNDKPIIFAIRTDWFFFFAGN